MSLGGFAFSSAAWRPSPSTGSTHVGGTPTRPARWRERLDQASQARSIVRTSASVTSSTRRPGRSGAGGRTPPRSSTMRSSGSRRISAGYRPREDAPSRAPEGEGRPRTRARDAIRFDCRDFGLDGHSVAALGVAVGHWAHAPWWARQVLNLRPLACEASALPLSYAPERWVRVAPGVPGGVPVRAPVNTAGHKETAARARVAPPSRPSQGLGPAKCCTKGPEDATPNGATVLGTAEAGYARLSRMSPRTARPTSTMPIGSRITV
jgi:hypothetical protein